MMGEREKNSVKYISDEDKKRFEDLFKSLDTNKDGTVDIQELTAALKGRKEPLRQAAVPVDFDGAYTSGTRRNIALIPHQEMS